MRRARVRLRDVAEAVGVHSSTVSRALDPKTRHLITPEIVGKVLRTADDLGYRPNSIAYSLRTSRSMTVGVLVPDITNVVFPPILRGIEDALVREGYVAIIVNTDTDPGRESSLIETLRARGVDGFILASAQRQDEAILNAIEDGIPIVTVNRKVDDPAVSSVTNDDEEGIRLAVAHVAGLGHEHVAHIGGPKALSTGLLRYRAFRKALPTHGLAFDKDLVAFSRAFNEEEGERACGRLLDGGKAFTALVCANDRLAIGAIERLRAHGLDCPCDVSVTGFNDMALVDRLRPPLTTIRIQHYACGVRAAAILLEQMAAPEGEIAPQHVVMPVELVVRGSTALPTAVSRLRRERSPTVARGAAKR